ncbi:hypothetical protein DFH08DRAFT_976576 [Mycena albidolilacea]|uniref:Uncharacterized protein n=1 Tax=Mycena albidolilacea TaxID=1033008 RepID=A0AAD7EA64_9AGAR|nr:hypothetical protein DFH08DRAFT_976576 [Mycena albidolilacea]
MFNVLFSRPFTGSSPDPYPSDGPGVNYIVTRDLVADVDAYEQGQIDRQTLLSRREIKMGESKDFFRRRHGYAKCQRRYRHEWKAMYTTPERKLTEHLVQDETRSARRARTVCSCRKRHTEWVDYLVMGGERGLEREFFRWIALRGYTSTATYF